VRRVGGAPAVQPDQETDTYSQLDERLHYTYGAINTSPFIGTKKAGAGSTYVQAFKDKAGNRLDGGKSYRLHLPANVPVSSFWSLTLYDTATRSMVQNGACTWPFFAERVGFTPEKVAATRAPEASAGAFPERERLLICLVDTLHDEAHVDDTLWAALRAEWTEEQLIELIALAGLYPLISFVTNALRIPPEPYGARFPSAGGRDGAGDGRSHPASPSGAS
jgi:hypothetical protein